MRPPRWSASHIGALVCASFACYLIGRVAVVRSDPYGFSLILAAFWLLVAAALATAGTVVSRWRRHGAAGSVPEHGRLVTVVGVLAIATAVGVGTGAIELTKEQRAGDAADKRRQAERAQLERAGAPLRAAVLACSTQELAADDEQPIRGAILVVDDIFAARLAACAQTRPEAQQLGATCAAAGCEVQFTDGRSYSVGFDAALGTFTARRYAALGDGTFQARYGDRCTAGIETAALRCAQPPTTAP